MSSKKSSINLKLLQDPYNDDFIPYLLQVPKKIDPRDSASIFELLIGHLEEQVPKEIGVAILIVIRVLLRNKIILNVFITNNFIFHIPFKNRYFTNEIFYILNFLVQNCPEVFDEELTNKFKSILTRNPSKSLAILCSYAKRFDEINTENPWPMIDTLIQGSKYFSTDELLPQYSSVLLFLLSQFEDYRRGRSNYCWDIFQKIVQSKSGVSSLIIGYQTLTVLYDHYQDGEIPIESIKTHLRIHIDISDTILAFLAAITQNPDPNSKSLFRDYEILVPLLDLAKTNIKATLILMAASSDIKVSTLLIGKSEWLLIPMPKFTDTLRLFLIIFNHDILRSKITSVTEFSQFLKMILGMNSPGVITIVCTIIRRMEVNQNTIDKLSNSGFLSEFFSTSVSLGDQVSFHSMLLMLDMLSKNGYTLEFIDICDEVAQILQNDKHLRQIASYVAVGLCKFEECARKMKSLNLDVFFENHLEDPQLKKSGQKFLLLMRKYHF